MKTKSEIVKMIDDTKTGAWQITMGLLFMFSFIALPLIFMIWGTCYIIGIILCGAIIFGGGPSMNFWEKVGVFVGVIGTTVSWCYLMGKDMNR